MDTFEYVRQFTGRKVTVFLDNNVIRIFSGDLEMVFTANAENYVVLQNTDLLGGDYIRNNGIVEIINQRPCQFQSGETYTVTFVEFYTDVEGVTDIVYKDVFCSFYIELESEDHRFCDITMDSDIITLTEEKRSADRGKANVRKLKKLSSEQVKEIVQTQFKGHEISKEKFSELLFGDDRQWSVCDMTEGLVTRENARFFLINDQGIINTHCKCVIEDGYNTDSYRTYLVYPYILLAVSENAAGYIDEYYFMSSFDEDIMHLIFE